MRQGSNSKRSRSKGGNRGANGSRHPLNRSFESNGPGGKVRGNPHQVYEKYLSMARDYQAEDPIMAENLLQHADHYFRVILDANGAKSRRGDGEDKNAASQNAEKGGDAGNGASARDGDGSEGPDAEAGVSSAGSEEADGAQATAEEDASSGPKRSRRGRKSKSDDDSGTNATASDAA